MPCLFRHWKVAKLDSFQHLLVKHSNQRDLVFESCHSKTRYREIMSLFVQNLVIVGAKTNSAIIEILWSLTSFARPFVVPFKRTI